MAKRKSPRKKAVNAEQVDQQLQRYSRLLDKHLAALTTTAKRVEQYNRKVKYYQARKAAVAEEQRQQLVRALEASLRTDRRPLRAIAITAPG